MRIPLDRQSDIPLYQQIKTHLHRTRACLPAGNWPAIWA